MAKLVAAETATLCADATVQILGGDGLTKEYGRAEQIYRDARALPIVGGTSEMARYLIAVRRPSDPQAEPVSRMNIPTLLLRTAERFPDRVALIIAGAALDVRRVARSREPARARRCRSWACGRVTASRSTCTPPSPP